MTKLDRVEAIDLIEQTLTDGAAQHVKRVRRDREDRSTAGAELPDILKVLEFRDLCGAHVQQDDIGALQTDLGRGN